jgi:prolyl-tRNA synthetase
MAQILDGTESSNRLVLAIVRGDMDLNETKLANVVNAKELRPALEEEIIASGAVPGYASPKGLKETLVVVDDVIPDSPNLVAGANEAGFHLRNVNYERDYTADVVADITVAEEGSSCPDCGHTLIIQRGVEVGNIFKLGTHFSESMGANFLDAEGNLKPVIMGSYGIGSGRLMASVVEEHHDDYGIIWPISIAPYSIHLIVLPSKSTLGQGEERDDHDPVTIADRIYQEFQASGLEILYDDRQESPGVKFNDADLLGIPIRVTVSERALRAGGIEVKRRDEKEKNIIPTETVVEHVKMIIAELQGDLDRMVISIPFEE